MKSALEARVEYLETLFFQAPWDAFNARLGSLENAQWQNAGGGGPTGAELACKVRVTVAAAAATAPAYTTGTGVLQYDTGSSPYADVDGAPTVTFKNDHDKIIKTGYVATLLKVMGDWWVVDVSSCNGLG